LKTAERHVIKSRLAASKRRIDMRARRLREACAGIGGTLLVSLVASVAWGHHGWSWYGQEEFSLTGRVVEKHFGNPHDRLMLEADGKQWNLVLSPPQRSRRAGFSDTEVEVGETVTAFGHRHRESGTLEMKTERIQVGDKTYDLYPDRL
jgi:hypothetical protein